MTAGLSSFEVYDKNQNVKAMPPAPRHSLISAFLLRVGDLHHDADEGMNVLRYHHLMGILPVHLDKNLSHEISTVHRAQGFS